MFGDTESSFHLFMSISGSGGGFTQAHASLTDILWNLFSLLAAATT